MEVRTKKEFLCCSAFDKEGSGVQVINTYIFFDGQKVSPLNWQFSSSFI